MTDQTNEAATGENSKATTATPTEKLVKKIASATIGLTKLQLLKQVSNVEQGQRVLVARIVGEMDGTREYVDPFAGEVALGMTGQFGALSVLEPNMLYSSGVCYLPSFIHDFVVSKFLATNRDISRGKKPIKFGFDVYVIADDKSATGYTFDLDQTIPMEVVSKNTLTMLTAGGNFGNLDVAALTHRPEPIALVGNASEASTSGDAEIVDIGDKPGDTEIVGIGDKPKAKGKATE